MCKLVGGMDFASSLRSVLMCWLFLIFRLLSFYACLCVSNDLCYHLNFWVYRGVRVTQKSREHSRRVLLFYYFTVKHHSMAPDTFGKPSLLLNASKSLIDVETPAFVANGLLSGAYSSSDTPESQTQVDEDAVDAFCPSTTSQSESVGRIDEDGAASASSFVTTGLLGASTTSNTSTTTTRSPSTTTGERKRNVDLWILCGIFIAVLVHSV